MNKVILVGRLTRDPEMRYSQDMAIAKFSVAVDRRRADPDEKRGADFPDCVAFGKQAEFAEKWLHKGSRIALSGRLQTGSYTDRDGRKVYTTDVIAEELEFAESKAEADAHRGREAQPAQPTQQPQQPQGGYGGYRQPQGGYGQAAQPSGQYRQPQQAPAGQAAYASASAPGGMPEGFMDIPDDIGAAGLPFN